MSTARLQESETGGSRWSALLGLVSEFGWYVRFAGSYFGGALTQTTLDSFYQEVSSHDGSGLCISGFDNQSIPFLSLLKSQATDFEGLMIKKCIFEDICPLQRFVSTNGEGVRRLQIVVGKHGKQPLRSPVRSALKDVQENFHRYHSRIVLPSSKSALLVSGRTSPFARFLQSCLQWLHPTSRS